MADYIYLLEHRLSAPQSAAVHLLRELAAANAITLFLVGGAVRDLTSGSPVRDLDFVVQGDTSAIRPGLEQAGVEITGEHPPLHALYLRMQGGVRAELGSTLSATWPKPSKPVFAAAALGEDLRRRDFTANAMALSLNEGSYGLLIDPLNGVADIENRQLRLVSNYGFIEEPVRLLRAARLMARLGWTLEEKTEARFRTGVEEGYAVSLNGFQRGYELEEIVHEEDPLRVLKRLEADGWIEVLAPFWTSAKINAAELDKLRETQSMLQTQGIATDGGAAAFPLLTAKLSAREVTELKASFPRQGFVREIEALEVETKDFVAQLTAKAAANASAAWKLIHAAKPEAVLQAAFSSRSAAVQAKFRAFSSEWTAARQKIPYALMQEMRIGPDIEGYAALVDLLGYELMDGKLSTTEEMKAFLEPYSPPAPAPPASLKRARASKKEAKAVRSRSRKNKPDSDELSEEEPAVDLDSESLPDEEEEVSEVRDPETRDEPDEAEDEPRVRPPASRSDTPEPELPRVSDPEPPKGRAKRPRKPAKQAASSATVNATDKPIANEPVPDSEVVEGSEARAPEETARTLSRRKAAASKATSPAPPVPDLRRQATTARRTKSADDLAPVKDDPLSKDKQSKTNPSRASSSTRPVDETDLDASSKRLAPVARPSVKTVASKTARTVPKL